MNCERVYIIIDLRNLKDFLRTGRIIPEPILNGVQAFDDDPCRLFANTFDRARHFCGRSFLLFLLLEFMVLAWRTQLEGF